MDLTSPKTIQQILREYKIFPNKNLGQHFIVNQSFIKQLLGLADLQENDIIVEVGPGLGAITQELLKQSAQVIAVEIDKRLAAFLRQRFGHLSNFILIQNDIISLPEAQLPTSYKLVANLPFQITSPLLKRFLWEVKNKPKLLVLGLQKEVAARLSAKPPQMNRLAILVQSLSHIRRAGTYPPSSFYPQPAVETSLVKLTPKTLRRDQKLHLQAVFKLAEVAFQQKRKKLLNSLKPFHSIIELKKCLAELGLSPDLRPQQLSLTDWHNLAQCLNHS